MGHHGHAVNPDREYRLLQQRLDRTVTGAPGSPLLDKILRILVPPEDVSVARQLPLQLTVLEDIAVRVGIPAEALSDRLTAMAQRGLVFDLEHQGRRYLALAPMALGFFEFAFMRVRDDIPQAELARLFEEYMCEDPERVYGAVFGGRTQIGRTLVREEALPDDGPTEILDWERASRIIQTASAVAVGMCACRHKAQHLGRACNAPQRVCLTLNYAADAVVRTGFGERITSAEGMRILETAKAAGLVQVGDNVRRRVSYLCNCCACCCEMFQAVKTGGIRTAITTSNWILEIDPETCSGCGRCAQTCPLGAIRIDGRPEHRNGENIDVRSRRCASVDAEACLGCGVCFASCKSGAMAMKPRARRVFNPDTIFDRMALMAIERGKLADFLLDRPEQLGARTLGRIVAILERTPLLKAVVAVEPLCSTFLRRIVRAAKRQAGAVAQVAE